MHVAGCCALDYCMGTIVDCYAICGLCMDVCVCVRACACVYVRACAHVACVSMCMSLKCMFSEPLLLGSPVVPPPAQQQGELPSLTDLYIQTESLQLSKLN